MKGELKMKVSQQQLDMLKQYGFLWLKNKTTDRVESFCIHDVVPAANGFTVIYETTSALEMSTAVVKEIEFPEDLDTQWIRVKWEHIEDQRREAA